MAEQRLVAALLVLLGCGSPIPREPDCILPDGTEFVGGQSVAGDLCQACDARTGEVRRVWGPTCGGFVSREVEGTEVRLGPDADGDGLGDVAVGGWSVTGVRRGMARVYSAATGEVIFEVEGERDDLEMTNVVLGPDISGDGLADLLVASANSASDIRYEGDMPIYDGAPNPGLVIAYEPTTGRELGRWEGERPCQSVGESIDMARDADGDGLGELMIYDPGCFDGVEAPRGFLRVESGAAARTLVDLEWTGGFGGYAISRPRLLDLDGRVRVAYLRNEDLEERVIHLDVATGDALLDHTVGNRITIFALPWNYGFDFTGDGAPDAIARIAASDLVPPFEGDEPIILFPDMEPPVGEYTVTASGRDSMYEVLADTNGDGRDDVLYVSDPFSRSSVFALRSPSGDIIYSHEGAPTPGRPDAERFVGAISRPYDIDGDGCTDFATIAEILDDHSTSNLEIHRCAGW